MTTMAKAKSNTHRSEQVDGVKAKRVLIVEDEPDIQDLLSYNIGREGFDVVCADRGELALKIVEQHPPDLILLDLMLPGMDGLAVCRHLKGSDDTAGIPIVMLTAKGEETDVVVGLEMGADDYITKPFSPRILAARLKAVLRRPAGRDAERDGPGAVIRTGSLVITPERHEALVSGESVDLTATEFRLLCLLAGRVGRVFTRQQIIESVHEGFAAVTDRSVDVQIVSLRRKLGEAGKRIETVRGVGYRFQD